MTGMASAAVLGLTRSDPRRPGISRVRIAGGFAYRTRCLPGRTRADGMSCNSHDVSAYIADHAASHFTAREFRTSNATVLMALRLASAAPAASARDVKRSIAGRRPRHRGRRA